MKPLTPTEKVLGRDRDLGTEPGEAVTPDCDPTRKVEGRDRQEDLARRRKLIDFFALVLRHVDVSTSVGRDPRWSVEPSGEQSQIGSGGRVVANDADIFIDDEDVARADGLGGGRRRTQAKHHEEAENNCGGHS
jgi:hypothetical protein